MSVTECYQHKIVNKSNLNSFSLSLASALHQSANSTTFIASALVLKFSAFLTIDLMNFQDCSNFPNLKNHIFVKSMVTCEIMDDIVHVSHEMAKLVTMF